MEIIIKINSMKERGILDRFTKSQEKKLKIIPKYINGNFVSLEYWLKEKKEFNKNTKEIRLNFWRDLKDICKKNKIRHSESK